MKNLQGDVIASQQEKQERWKEHSEKVLNRDDPAVEANIPPAEETLDINLDPPSEQEVRLVIMKLKNGKLQGSMGYKPNY